jgi:hypothetical protein
LKRTCLITLLSLSLSASAGLAQSTSRQSFVLMKNLAGKWRGKDTLGNQVEVTFRVMSKGSAILSEYVESGGKEDEDMVTMIHLDGDRLLATHYCSAGNQPRMKGTLSPDGKTITFDFVDATNLSSPQAGHMQRLVIKFSAPIITQKNGRSSRMERKPPLCPMSAA